jgi:hypothetical protein
MVCTKCDGFGFWNYQDLPDDMLKALDDGKLETIIDWLKNNHDCAAAVCDCCGDGEGWYGEPGLHRDCEYGKNGPYAYNGGLPKCY